MAILDDCADALQIALPEAVRGNAGMAKVFDDVLEAARASETPQARELETLAVYGAGVLAKKLGRPGEAAKRWVEAAALAGKLGDPCGKLDTINLLADALMELGENRRAIAYCNRAVALTRRNSPEIGVRLWRTGRAYVRAGFSAQAQAPLREAIGRLRSQPHLLLKYALLDLGNAAIKSDPATAEPAILEAAEIFEREGHLNQAATAWLNLGVLCARSQRLDEALSYYGRVLQARASDPNATVAQRGNIHNNIAGVYRRKGEFGRAREEVERAIAILKPLRGEMLAHAYGSYGEICRDGGDAKAALGWFRKARQEYERLASPNLERWVEKLENEVAALERLGRAAEAAPLRDKIAGLTAEIAPTVPDAPQAEAPVLAGAAPEGEVVVTLDGVGLASQTYAQYDLGSVESLIEARLAETGAGEWEGHEFGPQTVQLFLSGPDARALFDPIAPALRGHPLCRGANIELRQGASVECFALEAPTLH